MRLLREGSAEEWSLFLLSVSCYTKVIRYATLAFKEMGIG